MQARKQSLEYHEAVILDPVEKFEKFGRFPYKMIVHFLLLIFTTSQAVLIVAEANKYSRSQERFLYNMFIDDSDKRSVDFNRIAYLYDIDDIKNHVNNSISNFYSLKTKSLEIVQFNDENPFSEMEFTYIDNDRIQKTSKERVDNIFSPDLREDELDKDENKNVIYPFLRKTSNIKKKFVYKITKQSLGPFDEENNEIKIFLNDVVEFRLNYTLRTYVPFYYNNNYDCNLWNIVQSYNFASRAHFIVRLNIIRLACEDSRGNHSFFEIFVNKLLWIHMIVLILAIISLVMTWNYIQSMANMYMRVKTKHKQKKIKEDEDAYYTKSEHSVYYNPLLDEDMLKHEQEEIEKAKKAELSQLSYETNFGLGLEHNILSGISPDRSKHNTHHNPQHHQHHHAHKSEYKFDLEKKESQAKKLALMFNMWSIISLIGNIIQVFGSAISIFDTNNIMTSTEILVGFGCMLAFINIGRYIEYAENYSTIYITIKNSLPNVGRYLIGVMPIFLGFIFFGLCIFWRSERFTSTSSIMIILFALAQGDSVFDSFKDLSGIHFFLGQVYLYIFCIMFIV